MLAFKDKPASYKAAYQNLLRAYIDDNVTAAFMAAAMKGKGTAGVPSVSALAGSSTSSVPRSSYGFPRPAFVSPLDVPSALVSPLDDLPGRARSSLHTAFSASTSELHTVFSLFAANAGASAENPVVIHGDADSVTEIYFDYDKTVPYYVRGKMSDLKDVAAELGTLISAHLKVPVDVQPLPLDKQVMTAYVGNYDITDPGWVFFQDKVLLSQFRTIYIEHPEKSEEVSNLATLTQLYRETAAKCKAMSYEDKLRFLEKINTSREESVETLADTNINWENLCIRNTPCRYKLYNFPTMLKYISEHSVKLVAKTKDNAPDAYALQVHRYFLDSTPISNVFKELYQEYDINDGDICLARTGLEPLCMSDPSISTQVIANMPALVTDDVMTFVPTGYVKVYISASQEEQKKYDATLSFNELYGEMRAEGLHAVDLGAIQKHVLDSHYIGLHEPLYLVPHLMEYIREYVAFSTTANAEFYSNDSLLVEFKLDGVVVADMLIMLSTSIKEAQELIYATLPQYAPPSHRIKFISSYEDTSSVPLIYSSLHDSILYEQTIPIEVQILYKVNMPNGTQETFYININEPWSALRTKMNAYKLRFTRSKAFDAALTTPSVKICDTAGYAAVFQEPIGTLALL